MRKPDEDKFVSIKSLSSGRCFLAKWEELQYQCFCKIPPIRWTQTASMMSPASWHSHQIWERTTAACSGIKNWMEKLHFTFPLWVCITLNLYKTESIWTYIMSCDPFLEFSSRKQCIIDALKKKQVSIIYTFEASASLHSNKLVYHFSVYLNFTVAPLFDCQCRGSALICTGVFPYLDS